jgi:mRNA-degrading endonuclease RelE of RelBE toxin-antitoxin system
MKFRIAETFTGSLNNLTGEEKKSVKTTAFDLQLNPANPGMKFHSLDKAKDKNFWSVRVNKDIRLIVHKTHDSLLLCYVGHHDKAYRWGERRKLETHPKTGAAQIVEVRETVQEIIIPKYVEVEQPSPPKPLLFTHLTDDELLGYGVPQEWLNDVREANEDKLLVLADHLPAEAAEALLELATGGKPEVPKPSGVGADPFAHPDAQRRFRVMSNIEELERAFKYPWEKWTIFLHPAQRNWVERDYNGPARVSGSAGTGKTIVALHRSVFLAKKYPDARVLLTTFSEILANALRNRLKRLISNEPQLAERLEVHSIKAIGQQIFKSNFSHLKIISQEKILELLKQYSAEVDEHKFSLPFLLMEWEQVVDAWQLETWEAYRDVKRIGRKTRLPEKQRVVLWSIFEMLHERLKSENLITESGLFTKLAVTLAGRENPPFDFAIVDESQDISVSHLRFLAALGKQRPNSLFFAGDLGQRIFQQPFSWLAIGVDIRGRSRILNVNYRTSHQIRIQADFLLSPEISDADGNIEERSKTVSVFNGPNPTIQVALDQEAEIEMVGKWLTDRSNEGVMPHEFGIFVRSESEIDRARNAVNKSGLPFQVLDNKVETISGQLSISTMHLAKGLEFRAVVVMACDDDVIPLQERIETAVDGSELEEIYNTERHLLYVACTRARDQLLITGVNPASEFLDDIKMYKHEV